MNIEAARVIRTGPRAGRWNWTTYQPGVSAAPFTIPPCTDGRKACDHESREEAERHHWEYELARVRIESLSYDRSTEVRRCAFPGCTRWQTHRGRWPANRTTGDDPLCEEHADEAGIVRLHPIDPPSRVLS